jgi:hypothetical protein
MPKTKVIMIEQKVRQYIEVPADQGETLAAVEEYLNRVGWPDITDGDFQGLSVVSVKASKDDEVWRAPRE